MYCPLKYRAADVIRYEKNQPILNSMLRRKVSQPLLFLQQAVKLKRESALWIVIVSSGFDWLLSSGLRRKREKNSTENLWSFLEQGSVLFVEMSCSSSGKNMGTTVMDFVGQQSFPFLEQAVEVEERICFMD